MSGKFDYPAPRPPGSPDPNSGGLAKSNISKLVGVLAAVVCIFAILYTVARFFSGNAVFLTPTSTEKCLLHFNFIGTSSNWNNRLNHYKKTCNMLKRKCTDFEKTCINNLDSFITGGGILVGNAESLRKKARIERKSLKESAQNARLSGILTNDEKEYMTIFGYKVKPQKLGRNLDAFMKKKIGTVGLYDDDDNSEEITNKKKKNVFKNGDAVDDDDDDDDDDFVENSSNYIDNPKPTGKTQSKEYDED